MRSLTAQFAAFVGVSLAVCTGMAAAQTPRDLKTMNVCQVVPGDAVAAAVGGKIAETRARKIAGVAVESLAKRR